MSDVKEIVGQWLRLNGFDGLCNAELECGCSVDDLAPCCTMNEDCRAAYRWRHDNDHPWCRECSLCCYVPDGPGCFMPTSQKDAK